MTPEEIAQDRAILAAATKRPWITVQPRSQEGGPAIAHFGPSFANDFPAATSVRLAGPTPATALDFALVVEETARITWQQHAANARAVVHVMDRLPAYIAEAEEMARRIAEIGVAADDADRAAHTHEMMSEPAAARMAARAAVLRWALKVLQQPAPCPRCTGNELLQNPEDGWRPGLVLTREAEDAVRAAFAGKPTAEVKQKWRACPLCNGTAVRDEK